MKLFCGLTKIQDFSFRPRLGDQFGRALGLSRKKEKQTPTTVPGDLKFKKAVRIGRSGPGHQYPKAELDGSAGRSWESGLVIQTSTRVRES